MTFVIRGQVVSFASDGAVLHEPKGAIVVGEEGHITWLGRASDIPEQAKSSPLHDYGNKLIMPGLIDAHIHFPQYRMLAAPGKDLLDWLSRFTFPEEARYSDHAYAAAKAEIFLDRLLSHGTTSALAFCSVHKACADALFGTG
jgi:guanine deaminase